MELRHFPTPPLPKPRKADLQVIHSPIPDVPYDWTSEYQDKDKHAMNMVGGELAVNATNIINQIDGLLPWSN